MKKEIYLHGMTCWSTIHLLEGEYPKEDTYGEIRQTFRVPGGEAMNAAMILSGLGLGVTLDGPDLGFDSREGVKTYAARYGIDISGMTYNQEFRGVCDTVLVAGKTRTVLGNFDDFCSPPPVRWTTPDNSRIQGHKAAGIDPCLGEQSVNAAEYCHQHQIPYVTLDCESDSMLHRYSEATILSGEYIDEHYPHQTRDEVLSLYAKESSGVTVITAGAGEIRFKRGDQPIEAFSPPKIQVVSTLGAGDTFRAGMIFGVHQGWSDRKSIEFASRLAGWMIQRVPIGDNIPTLQEILSI